MIIFFFIFSDIVSRPPITILMSVTFTSHTLAIASFMLASSSISAENFSTSCFVTLLFSMLRSYTKSCTLEVKAIALTFYKE